MKTLIEDLDETLNKLQQGLLTRKFTPHRYEWDEATLICVAAL
jgi:hypothetical protein